MEHSHDFVTPVAYAAVTIGLFRYLSWRKQQWSTRNLPSLVKPEAVPWLNQSQYEVLVAICDTLLPSLDPSTVTSSALKQAFSDMCSDVTSCGILGSSDLSQHESFFARGALAMNIPALAAEVVQHFVPIEGKQDLSLFLTLFSSTLPTLLITGHPQPFAHLSLTNRCAVLATLRDHPVAKMRAAYQSFKRLCCSLFLSYAKRNDVNPNWKHLNYAPITPIPSERPRTIPTPLWGANPLSCDVVVVGSGAGGGVMAAELVKAGLSVILLDKGGYYRADTFKQWTEAEAFARMFDFGGFLTSKDGNIVVLAGSCVGGGTTVNWSASFDLPEAVRRDWESFGLDKFRSGGEYLQAYAAVKKMINVNTRFSHRDGCTDNDCCNSTFAVNNNNKLLWRGAEKLGFRPEKIPRNVKDCVDCGNCCFGCAHEAKQSTLTALLEPLLSTGRLTIIPHAYVHEVLYKNKTATGVRVTVSEYDSDYVGPDYQPPINTRELIVNARVVVVSGGAIQTPALLLRSNFKHPLIGKHLTLHPVLSAGGMFPDLNTGLSKGVGMGVVVKSPTIEREADKGYGLALETPPIHTGLYGLAMPWMNPLAYKTILLQYQHASVVLAISRDHSQKNNCVKLSKEGLPEIHYTVTPEDEKNLILGLVTQLRVLRAAGARVINMGSEHPEWFVCDDEGAESDAKFEAYLQRVTNRGIKTSSTQIFSAHQMGTCRMATSPADGPVQPTGELYECNNVYVADGSVLPTSLGVNPMLTIEAMAFMISREVLAKLGVKPAPVENVKEW